MDRLGKMKKITDLRNIWAHESRDFSKWLSQEEGLALLSDAVGFDIVFLSAESSVGSFNVDIFAEEYATNRKIVIENQLEETNHDHLGKIITYAAGKSADVIIWIVKKARDEHRKAIEWLNDHTDENIGFFLIEIELWQIGDSLPAPKFNVVESPNDWAKTMKTTQNLTALNNLQLKYWKAFIDYSESNQEFKRIFNNRKPNPQHWYNLSVGNSSCYISLTVNSQKNRIGADLYFPDDKPLYEHFKEHQQEIERELNSCVEWHVASKACRILVLTDGDINKEEEWNSAFLWYCEMALKLRSIADKYGKM